MMPDEDGAPPRRPCIRLKSAAQAAASGAAMPGAASMCAGARAAAWTATRPAASGSSSGGAGDGGACRKDSKPVWLAALGADRKDWEEGGASALVQTHTDTYTQREGGKETETARGDEATHSEAGAAVLDEPVLVMAAVAGLVVDEALEGRRAAAGRFGHGGERRRACAFLSDGRTDDVDAAFRIAGAGQGFMGGRGGPEPRPRGRGGGREPCSKQRV
ncbi:hypothetical protein CDD83_157 [Cordyceps sp. RAO-2017]|nr:hypothetical protein CDD83_157 [Cordyceps sp. RAO-2017]